MQNIRNLRASESVTSWRRLAVATWGEPADPTVYGSLDVDVTRALAYLARKQAESDHKLTITHLVGRCLAQCMREFPDSNVVIRRGRFFKRPTVDMFFQVSIPGRDPKGADDLSGAVVREADTRSIVAIAADLNRRAEKIRKDEDEEVSKVKSNLQWVPPGLLKIVLRVVDFFSYTLNVKLPGMPRDPFGSAMVTSMGMFGIARAWAPLFPPSHCPIVLMVGAIERRPWVLTDEQGQEELTIRDVMTLCVAFDHRVMDGVLGAKLTQRIDELLHNPDLLDALDAAQATES